MDDNKTYEEIVASFDGWRKTLKECLEYARTHYENDGMGERRQAKGTA